MKNINIKIRSNTYWQFHLKLDDQFFFQLSSRTLYDLNLQIREKLYINFELQLDHELNNI